MKRIICAAAIIVVIAALTIAGNLAVSQIADEFSDSFDRIEYCALLEDEKLAENEVKLLRDNFKEKRHLLEAFIKRDYISNLYVSIEGLNAYTNSETWRDLESEVSKAREQLKSITHIFYSII